MPPTTSAPFCQYYTGSTIINQGTLTVDGGVLGSGNIVFNGSGTLQILGSGFPEFGTQVNTNITINAGVTATIDVIGGSANYGNISPPGPSRFIGGAGGLAVISSKADLVNNGIYVNVPQGPLPAPAIYTGPTTIYDTDLTLFFQTGDNPPQAGNPYYLPINGKNTLYLGGALSLFNDALTPASLHFSLSTSINLIANTSSEINGGTGGGTIHAEPRAIERGRSCNRGVAY